MARRMIEGEPPSTPQLFPPSHRANGNQAKNLGSSRIFPPRFQAEPALKVPGRAANGFRTLRRRLSTARRLPARAALVFADNRQPSNRARDEHRSRLQATGVGGFHCVVQRQIWSGIVAIASHAE